MYYFLAMVTATAEKKESKKTAQIQTEMAVIETGGKQYVVSVGDVLEIEKLPGEHKEGDKVSFDKVLLVDDGKDTTIGTPYIEGAKVNASYVADTKGKKLSIIRFKAKSNRSRKIGHRQKYSKIKIESFK